ncbi:hypothetical protein IKF15_01285 [Candidatus Saccharibacteria bacterium]|nr:hypothetical protein [Candidatus Saccharibacteria bacterium]
MGILVENNNERTRLTERISADLRERTTGTSRDDAAMPDLVEDSEYLRNTKRTSRSSWFWIALVVLALIALGIILLL